MAKRKAAPVPAPASEPVNPFAGANAILRDSLDKYTVVMVLGLKDGSPFLSINTNLGDLYHMRGILVEAIDELNNHKKRLIEEQRREAANA